MLAEVELIAVAGLEHFEAVRALKIDCVLVELTEVSNNVIVERRSEIANLNNKNTLHSISESTCTHRTGFILVRGEVKKSLNR